MNATREISGARRAPSKQQDRWPSMRVGGPIAFGIIVFGLFFGGLGAWGALAPLESAAIAPGFVVVQGNRKQVQHLEGGIVADILVEEGSYVTAGQPLIYLDETQARASLGLLRSQLRASVALEARLIAERDDLAEIEFPDWLVKDITEAGATQILRGQERIFSARREAVESQTRILEQRTTQIKEEITGLRAEIRAQDRQLALIREEEASVKDLLEKGYERRPRLLALQRAIAELEGARAQNVARVARAKQNIGENELRAIDLRVQILNDAVQKLREEQNRIADLTERIRAAQDILERTTITAPVSGRVVNLQVFTRGGVITPRETVMDIVPQDDALMISAQVSPIDIDVVRAGLPVQLRFVALNRRVTPTLSGEVVTVSADRLTDERTGSNYFEALIAIDEDQVFADEIIISPGMPVDAMILTGEQTALAYLTKPIMGSINRALREQ